MAHSDIQIVTSEYCKFYFGSWFYMREDFSGNSVAYRSAKGIDVHGAVLNGCIPSIRYTSGLTVYDEALLDGIWISRYWASDGKVTAEHHIAETLPEQFFTLPLNSFCLEIDGQALHKHWQWGNVYCLEQHEAEKCVAVVELHHSLRPIALKITTVLDGTPFLTRWLTITNNGKAPAALSSVSPWSGPLWAKKISPYYLQDKKEHPFTLGYFQSSNPHWEGDFAWKALSRGVTRVEGRRGHSGYGLPFFIMRNESTGEYFFGHLEWSGNWHAEFTLDYEPHGEDMNLIFRLGPSGVAPQRIIEPGETIETPAVHLGFMHADLDTCIQLSHDHLRRSMLAQSHPAEGKRRYLVKYSTLNESGVYFPDKSRYEESILKQVDIAADLGVELFIVENAWHGKAATHGMWGIAGDWWPNAWLPNDLMPIREYVRSKNMLFGLYAEIETIGFDSDLFAKHPDWALMKNGRPVIGHQRDKRGLLDLTKPEVAAWMESEILRLIRQYDLDMFRLDANVRLIFDGGERIADGYCESTLWRYYESLYQIWDRLRKACPNVIFQQASSGGCRNDIAMLRRFSEAFLTDGTHPTREISAFNGLSVALPPEIFNIMVGLIWFSNEPRGSHETQLRLSMVLSHPYIADVGIMPPDSGDAPQARLDSFRRYICLFKEFVRPLLQDCKMYHHAPVTPYEVRNDWFAFEYTAPDSSRALAMVVRLENAAGNSYTVRFRGLDRSHNYRVTFDNSRQQIKLSGYQLSNEGVTVRLETMLESELLLVERE